MVVTTAEGSLMSASKKQVCVTLDGEKLFDGLDGRSKDTVFGHQIACQLIVLKNDEEV